MVVLRVTKEGQLTGTRWSRSCSSQLESIPQGQVGM
jgi:hypothetical protein